MKLTSKFFIILYSTTLVIFLIYILFLAENNVWKHHELQEKIESLNQNITNSKSQIKNTYTYEELIKDSILLEKYVREDLDMQKENEDVYIIVE